MGRQTSGAWAAAAAPRVSATVGLSHRRSPGRDRYCFANDRRAAFAMSDHASAPDDREQSWRRPAAAGRTRLVFVQNNSVVECLRCGWSRRRRGSLCATSRDARTLSVASVRPTPTSTAALSRPVCWPDRVQAASICSGDPDAADRGRRRAAGCLANDMSGPRGSLCLGWEPGGTWSTPPWTRAGTAWRPTHRTVCARRRRPTARSRIGIRPISNRDSSSQILRLCCPPLSIPPDP